MARLAGQWAPESAWPLPPALELQMHASMPCWVLRMQTQDPIACTASALSTGPHPKPQSKQFCISCMLFTYLNISLCPSSLLARFSIPKGQCISQLSVTITKCLRWLTYKGKRFYSQRKLLRSQTGSKSGRGRGIVAIIPFKTRLFGLKTYTAPSNSANPGTRPLTHSLWGLFNTQTVPVIVMDFILLLFLAPKTSMS